MRKIAERESVRVFFAHNQHIAFVMGTKPRSATAIDLVETTTNPKMPSFRLQFEGDSHPVVKKASPRDLYYILKPILSGPAQKMVCIEHARGYDLVQVEPGGEGAFHSDPLSPVRSKPASHYATGYSQNFSFDEAFQDALKQLPGVGRVKTAGQIDVVSMGAIYGGFHGFSRLFLRLEQSQLLPAGSISNPTKKRA